MPQDLKDLEVRLAKINELANSYYNFSLLTPARHASRGLRGVAGGLHF